MTILSSSEFHSKRASTQFSPVLHSKNESLETGNTLVTCGQKSNGDGNQSHAHVNEEKRKREKRVKINLMEDTIH